MNEENARECAKLDANNNEEELQFELDEPVTKEAMQKEYQQVDIAEEKEETEFTEILAAKSSKEELLQSLVHVKWLQKAIDIIKILDASEKAAGESCIKLLFDASDTEESQSDDENSILEQFQNTAGSCESRDHLIQTFLRCYYFSNSKDPAKENVSKLFANLLSLKDTKQIVREMKSIINSEYLRKCELYEKQEPFKKMFFMLRDYCNYETEKILSTIFSIYLSKVVITDDEKKEIGERIVDALKPIRIYVQLYCYSGELGWSTWILQKRSALQFLYDEFGKCTVGNVNLAKNMKVTIALFERFMIRWWDNWNLTARERDFARYVFDKIPKIHKVWWAKPLENRCSDQI